MDLRDHEARPRAFVYARTAAADPFALGAQLASCLKLAAAEGLLPADGDVCADLGTSGLGGSPALQELLALIEEAARDHRIVLYIADLSRLGRDAAAIDRIRHLADLHVEVRTPRQGPDCHPDRILHLPDLHAEDLSCQGWESHALMSRRVAQGRERAAALRGEARRRPPPAAG
jgi:hypothetical protein